MSRTTQNLTVVLTLADEQWSEKGSVSGGIPKCYWDEYSEKYRIRKKKSYRLLLWWIQIWIAAESGKRYGNFCCKSQEQLTSGEGWCVSIRKKWCGQDRERPEKDTSKDSSARVCSLLNRTERLRLRLRQNVYLLRARSWGISWVKEDNGFPKRQHSGDVCGPQFKQNCVRMTSEEK